MKTLKTAALGQLSSLAAVRRRMTRVAAGDSGSPSRLIRAEAIKQARGAFKNFSGPSLEEIKRMDLEEELEAEEREEGLAPG